VVTQYNHSAIEAKWQAYWDKNKTFLLEDSNAEKLYVLDMFPYPSGSGLHVGHPLGYTATDIYSRFKRMQGFSVLHPMGFDAFGLPAEQYAITTGQHPRVGTKRNCERFREQLKKLGLSYDWSREVSSCDEDYYQWTQWIFLKIYDSWFDETQQKARSIEELPVPDDVKAGGDKAVYEYQAEHRLAYYADAMVNWCPALGTVLANEEVIDGRSERGGHEVIRKPMHQWLLRITKYSERLLADLETIDWPHHIKEQQRNWIGKSEGAEINFQVVGSKAVIACFTTRPDTLFGATFFTISPEHPLVNELTTTENREEVDAYCKNALKLSELARTMGNREKTGVFTGSYVINPVNEEEIPVFIGDYVLMSYGTGAVMAVPSHDERDFEFARKFEIPVRPVIRPSKAIDETLNAVVNGEMPWTEPGVMLPSDEAIARELGLEGKSSVEAKQLITNWLEKHGKGRVVVKYRLKDWLFSRQRYWGEPIPIIHWEDGTATALKETELPLRLPAVENYKPTADGESPLAKAKDWLWVEDSVSGMKGRRETNTMPQWAGSCWYYLRYIDPGNTEVGWDPEKEARWMPVDLYVGGAEHAVLHLLYARFWHKVLFDLGYVSTNEPFQKLFNQGLLTNYAYKDCCGVLIPVDVVDEDSAAGPVHKETGERLEKITAKMSKSLKNVVTPDEIIESYGADTLRTFLMFLGPLEAGKQWDSQAINGTFRFLKKVFALVTGGSESGIRDVVSPDTESQTVIKARHATTKKVTHDIDSLRFNTAISALMEFVNELTDKDLSKETLETLTLLLSPFAPHLAEELWQRLGHVQSLAYAEWPKYDENLLKEDTVSVVVQIGGKKRGLVEVNVGISEDALKELIVSTMAETKFKVTATDRFIIVFRPNTKIPKLVNVITG
jgi:leucyl-tRNA synthetase